MTRGVEAQGAAGDGSGRAAGGAGAAGRTRGELRGRSSLVPHLDEYVPVFLAWSKALHRGSTHKLHEDNCAVLVRLLGRKRLDEITRADVEGFMVARAQESRRNVTRGKVRIIEGTVSNATVNRAVTTLKLLFRKAQGAYPRLDNPARSVELLPESAVQRILTDEEWARYLANARQPLKDVAILMRERGLRPQDACSLKCGQCDFERQTVELWPKPQPMIARRVSSVATAGKTENSSRQLDVSPRMSEVLSARVSAAKEIGTEFLFPMRNRRRRYQLDRPLRPGSLDKPHQKALKAAGIPDRVRLYDLRHTFATMATRQGMPLGVLQDMLGHADPAMTRRYTQRNDLAAQRAFFSRTSSEGSSGQ
ncbi:MAG TPA: site-specific integrase [Terriglobia bacterium]|nr:site-specific integrase [Terriglobia bacterium]